MRTHTYAHSIILSLLFPECQLSLGSFDCTDCNEFSVYMTMNIILLLLLLLLQPLFFCTLPSGSRFYYAFSPSHLQHQKKICNNDDDDNNNSSSDKDDNSWLDECFSICVL